MKKIILKIKDISLSQLISVRKLIKIFFAGTLLCSANNIHANSPTEQNSNQIFSIVQSIKSELPIKTEHNGTIFAIESPSTPLTVTTNLGDVKDETMSAPEFHETIKNMAIDYFKEFLGYPYVSLAQAALNAGIPFAIHCTASNTPTHFTVIFTLQDLEKALCKEPSDK